MCHCYFALRIEPNRLVAKEVTDRAAAASLDAGEPVLLGTVADLRVVARRIRLPLVTILRHGGPSRSATPAPGTPDRRPPRPRLLAEVA